MEKKSEPWLLIQSDLNDHVRNLSLTKDNAEHFELRLEEKNLLADDTAYYCYRNKQKEFLKSFSQHES